MFKSWKTSVMGLLVLAMAAFKIYTNPAIIADPDTLAMIVAGTGLLAAKDAGVTGK